MRDGRWQRLALLVILPLGLACAAKRPVVYPDDHVREVGEAVVQRDIDECLEFATDRGFESRPPARKTAEGAAVGSAVGAAVGTAVGAVLGNPGRGAGAGAAGGATRGGLGGLLRSGEPDPVQRSVVEECLRDKEYRPVGWR
jgi:uncharacterized protein YcfJ